jgi:protoheme IX farnesyltransferase
MSTAIDISWVGNRGIHLWNKWGKERAILLFALGKIKISLLVTLTTATGYLLAEGGLTIRMLVTAAAVFLLSCGSCALNQYQERETDRLMDRTKGRPLPSGKLRPGVSLLISLSLLVTGETILAYGTGPAPWALGLLAILWYNGIYTYLKKKTPFAAIPGALIGMIPPVLGWVAGGGNLLDQRIGVIGVFFFTWQVPHFWLLLLDRRMDYEKAGFPSLIRIFTPMQLRRITSIWIFATVVTCMIMPLFGLVRSHVVNGSLFAVGFWMVWKTLRILTNRNQGLPFGVNFKVLNSYMLIVILLLAMDKLIPMH